MIEKEIKYLLSQEDFIKMEVYLKEYLKKRIIQSNFYFDSQNFDLKKKRITVRVRIFSNKKGEITIKKGIKNNFTENINEAKIRIEETLPLPFKDIKNILKFKNIDRFLDKYEKQKSNFKIDMLGKLKTYRNIYNLFEGELFLDKSRYFKQTDYELEWEGNNLENANIHIKKIFSDLNIKPLLNKLSKSSRFIKELKRKREKRALFISFEGIDGSGKSTQVGMLKKYFEKKKKKVLLLKKYEPLDDIKKIILNKKEIDSTLLYLYTMLKHRFLMLKVKEEFNNYDVIIIDRYIDTSIAYTLGNVSSFEKEIFEGISNYVSEIFLQPDITFLMDTDPEIAYERKLKLGSFDLIEMGHNKNQNNFITNQSNAYNNYLKIAQKFKERYRIISTDLDIEETFKKILKEIIKYNKEY